MEHGVEVVVVMTARTGGGSGVRSDALFGFSFVLVDPEFPDEADTCPGVSKKHPSKHQ